MLFVMDLPETLIGETVRRGQILHSEIFDNIDHAKFFVVIGVTDDEVAGFFYINSRVNSLVNRKPEQLAMQYPIYAKDYGFLRYDSFICATNIVTRPKHILTRSISEGKTTFIDSLKAEHLNELLEKVRKSRLFSKYEKKRFFY